MWIILVVVLLIAVGLFIFFRIAGGGSFPWFQFYTKGKESGFNFHEINLLRKIAVENKLENPTSLFWSMKQLDRSIRGTVVRFRAQNRENNEEEADFISKLYEFRKRVEFSLPKYKLGIKTTRQMDTRQKLRITLPGVGNYSSTVVENLRKYIAISYPEGPKLPLGMGWKGQKININFWRANDAGYYFQTKVIGDFYEKEYPILHVAHSDSVIRTQKRKSLRAETNIPSKMYPLRTIDNANEEIEKSPGLRARLVDVSEDGCAVLIGGKAKVGLPVKAQFDLSGNTIVMSGVVKGVSYNQKKNRSTLHIQAVPPSIPMKNQILSFVYNIFNERETGQQRSYI